MPEQRVRDEQVAATDASRPVSNPVPKVSDTRPTAEQLGEWSFPASDPPATWTWDVEGPGHER